MTQKLYKLCQNGDYEKFIKLINRGIKFDVKKVFCNACIHGRFDFIKYLLDNYDVDYHYDNDFCFRILCKKNYYEIIEFMINTFEDIDYSANNYGAFRWGCKYGNIEIVNLLLNSFPDIDCHALDDWAFNKCCEGNHFEIVKILIKKFINERYSINNLIINNIMSLQKNNIIEFIEFLKNEFNDIGYDVYMEHLFYRCYKVKCLKGIKLIIKLISMDDINTFIKNILQTISIEIIPHKIVKYFIIISPDLCLEIFSMKVDYDPLSIYFIDIYVMDAINRNQHEFIMFYMDTYPGIFLDPYELLDGSMSWLQWNYPNEDVFYDYVNKITQDNHYDILKFIIDKFPNIYIHHDSEQFFINCCINGNFNIVYYLKSCFPTINHNINKDEWHHETSHEIRIWLEADCPIHSKMLKSAKK